MDANDFINKWEGVELKERSAAQSHFIDLCHLLGLADPVTEDPEGTWFTFEMGATKTTGGKGWADVWRRDCFAWEYKGKHANLDAAYAQVQRYAPALRNPPLLIVSDMARIVIRTNWTGAVQNTYELALNDLRDAKHRDVLRHCFIEPSRLKPTKTRADLTEDAAAKFAALAFKLRERGHDAHKIAHFVNRLVFCLFAEDSGLLPNKLLEKVLWRCTSSPEDFEELSRQLFRNMNERGVSWFGVEKIEWFNGGLFDDDTTIALTRQEIRDLHAAARLNWSEIDPSLLGTLFERGLDPNKRSQLGAHYTDAIKIKQIVHPVVLEPLQNEWEAAKTKIAAALAQYNALIEERNRTKAAAKAGALTRRANVSYSEAQKLHVEFLERLKNFRVLDPACGSGNFLNIALTGLKDLEHVVNLDAEVMGLQRLAPQVGPECVLGIELNPYAAELARVSVWIAEIQWMRRNGFDAARNPILRTLSTIENRDALLDDAGSATNWPEADAIVGNPPFLGNKKLMAELGLEYVQKLRNAWGDTPGGVDLVAYWVAGAWKAVSSGKTQRAGLVTTNSIRGGVNREVLKPIVEHGRIFEAWSDEPWTVDGAAVRVSMVMFDRGAGLSRLNGKMVERINPDLTGTEVDLTDAMPLAENLSVAFQGVKFGGPFEMTSDEANFVRGLVGNPNGKPNSNVIRRWFNGMDITRRPEIRWCRDFGVTLTEEEASFYEAPFEAHLSAWQKENDKRRSEGKRPLRAGEANTRDRWWIHQRPRPEMDEGLRGLSRFIATPEVSKHRIFVWMPEGSKGSGSVYSIARDDDTTFGILHSRIHEVWSLRMGTSLEDRPRYTSSSTFETFPFPEGLTPDLEPKTYSADPRAVAIALAARELDERRNRWLNPPELTVIETHDGFSHPVPKNFAAAKELGKRTLTKLYNTRPAWLAKLHATLDDAVADAYGWGAEWKMGMTDEQILSALFAINRSRR
ncbi:type II restriction/modification system DNA methylase subunit YeeA [Rhizobium sp. BK226]|uniref:class I SAM-dependent DNA methyltransferase n=1 Tax=Rhizobium sp. BK226 TaxID=2587075 RepID=UPI0016107AE8|nr:DNA methyltransferase [Rhizobium sp. BK226]MBB4114554.1 type II restriction/modification system DNA methylase subunit YeeA [Rhizobium sp. BK226]